MNAKILGGRIRLARERLSMSQDDLASAVGKDQRAISEYENGKRKLAATELPQFASTLQVPILFFFEGESALEDLDRVLLEEFHRFDTREARQSIVDVVRILAGMARLPE